MSGNNAYPVQFVGSDTKYIGRAILAGVASKSTGVLPQLVVLPLAYRAMGAEIFGVYGLIVGVVSTLMFFDLGLGPALTRLIAEDLVRARGRSKALVTGLLVAVCLSIISVCVGLAALHSGLLAIFWDNPALRSDAQSALAVGIFLVAIQPLASFAARIAAAGAMMDRYSGITAIGNVLSAVAAGVVIIVDTTPTALLLALNGVQTICRIFAGAYIWIKRYTQFAVWGFSKYLLKKIVSDGMWAVPIAGNGLVTREIVRFAVAGRGDAETLGKVSILIQIAIVIISTFGTFSAAKWPLMAAYITRRDRAAIRTSVSQFVGVGGMYLAVGIVVGVVECRLGMGRAWLGLGIENRTIIIYAVYVVLASWTFMLHSMIFAIGKLKWAVISSVLQWSVLAGLAAIIPINVDSAIGILIAAEVGIIIAMVPVVLCVLKEIDDVPY